MVGISNAIENVESPNITVNSGNKFIDDDFEKLRQSLSNITSKEQNITETVPLSFNKSLNDALNLIQNSFSENLPKLTPPQPITVQENFKQITEQVQKIINESTNTVNKVEKKENKIIYLSVNFAIFFINTFFPILKKYSILKANYFKKY